MRRWRAALVCIAVAGLLVALQRAQAQQSLSAPAGGSAAGRKAMADGMSAFQAFDFKTAVADFNAAAAAFDRLGDHAAADDARRKSANAECNGLLQDLPKAIAAGRLQSATTLAEYNPRFEPMCNKAGQPAILAAARRAIAQAQVKAPPSTAARPGPPENPPSAGIGEVAADRVKSEALTPDQRERARALFEHAFELLQSADDRGARAVFAQGLAIDPANTAANLYMGETLTRTGNDAQARTFYDRVVTLDPESAEAQQARAALAALDAARIDADNRIVVVVDVKAPFKTLADMETYEDELFSHDQEVSYIICAGSLSHAEKYDFCPFDRTTWDHGVYMPVPLPTDHFKCDRPEASASCMVGQRIVKKLKEKLGVDGSILMPEPHDAISDSTSGSGLTAGLSPNRFVFHLGVFPMTAVLQPIRAGKLRAIAVTGPTRSPNLPDVPTFAESGPGF